MKQNVNIILRFTVLCGLILLAAFSRLIPHMPNFSPLGAICLFGAAQFQKKWQAFVVPVAAAWLSDLFLNNIMYRQYFPEFTWFSAGSAWQYGSYLVIVAAGIGLFSKINVKRIAAGAMISTVLFFLISNFGVWYAANMYPANWQGLLNCYVAGMPFIKGTFLGDMVYSGILFGCFAWLQSRLPQIKVAHEKMIHAPWQ